MKATRKRLMMVAALTLTFAFLVTLPRKPSGFRAGPALPTGAVKPQIALSTIEALLVAPDGSLWGWGGNPLEPRGFLGKPVVASFPQRHSVLIFQPVPGTYRVNLVGLTAGLYFMSVRAFSQDGSPQPEFLRIKAKCTPKSNVARGSFTNTTQMRRTRSSLAVITSAVSTQISTWKYSAKKSRKVC